MIGFKFCYTAYSWWRTLQSRTIEATACSNVDRGVAIAAASRTLRGIAVIVGGCRVSLLPRHQLLRSDGSISGSLTPQRYWAMRSLSNTRSSIRNALMARRGDISALNLDQFGTIDEPFTPTWSLMGAVQKKHVSADRFRIGECQLILTTCREGTCLFTSDPLWLVLHGGVQREDACWSRSEACADGSKEAGCQSQSCTASRGKPKPMSRAARLRKAEAEVKAAKPATSVASGAECHQRRFVAQFESPYFSSKSCSI